MCFRLRVGELKTFIRTAGWVYHIEVDALHSENILFSDNYVLKVTNGINTSTLVGYIRSGYSEGIGTSAKFTTITGFTQINGTSVIVADSGNHCLRVFDREVLRTSQFIGLCTSSGYRDGLSPLFSGPYSVIRDVRSSNKLLVSDHNNRAVRQVDLITRLTITIISESNGLTAPRGLTFDIYGVGLHISTYKSISLYNFTSQTLTTVTGGLLRDFRDGNLSSAQFDNPREMVVLSSSVTVVADHHNHRLRVVNSATGEVKSIHRATGRYAEDSTLKLQLSFPLSLLKVNDSVIYVGHDYRIKTLPCE